MENVEFVEQQSKESSSQNEFAEPCETTQTIVSVQDSSSGFLVNRFERLSKLMRTAMQYYSQKIMDLEKTVQYQHEQLTFQHDNLVHLDQENKKTRKINFALIESRTKIHQEKERLNGKYEELKSTVDNVFMPMLNSIFENKNKIASKETAPHESVKALPVIEAKQIPVTETKQVQETIQVDEEILKVTEGDDELTKWIGKLVKGQK